MGGCALYAPLFGPATTAPKFCFRTHFCSLRSYALYTHPHAHNVCVCVCLCGARACGCVGVCIGVRAFLGVRFLVFREILAFICYVLKLTSLQSCFCFCCCCAAFAVFAVSLSLSLCLSLSLYLACLCA